MYSKYIYSSYHVNDNRRDTMSRAELQHRMLFSKDTADNLDFSHCDFSGADLSNLNLYTDETYHAPSFRGAIFNHANLSSIRLHGADLSNSRLFRANLKNSELSVVDFSNADLTGADLAGADLYLTRLSGAILHKANLNKADLSSTFLDGAYISDQTIFGSQLLQEDENEYKKFLMRYETEKDIASVHKKLRTRYYEAGKIYRSLEQCFMRNGNYQSASWAYRRARRAEKIWAYQNFIKPNQPDSQEASKSYSPRISNFIKWVNDCIVELVCDYGESVWRVLAWITLILFVVGPVIFGMIGSFEWSINDIAAYNKLNNPFSRMAYVYFQYILYMIDTFATTGFADISPSNDLTRLVSGLIALGGIFLIGLLGFVAGNRIRHS